MELIIQTAERRLDDYAEGVWDLESRSRRLFLEPPGGFVEHYRREVAEWGEERAQDRLLQLTLDLLSRPTTRFLLEHSILHAHPFNVMQQRLTDPSLQRAARNGVLMISVMHYRDGAIKLIAAAAKFMPVAPPSPREEYTVTVGVTDADGIMDVLDNSYFRRLATWILNTYGNVLHIGDDILEVSSDDSDYIRDDDDDDDEGRAAPAPWEYSRPQGVYPPAARSLQT